MMIFHSPRPHGFLFYLLKIQKYFSHLLLNKKNKMFSPQNWVLFRYLGADFFPPKITLSYPQKLKILESPKIMFFHRFTIKYEY